MKKMAPAVLGWILLGAAVLAPLGCAKKEIDVPLKAFVSNNKVGFEDQNHQPVISAQFDRYYAQWDGKFKTYDPTHPQATMDQINAESRPFSNGLCAVQVGDKWGFIDPTGKYQINPVYDSVQPFHKGLALVKMGNRCQLIDKNGQTAKELNYDDVSDAWFYGLAQVKKDGLIGYMDADYKEKIAPQYTEAYQNFLNGLTYVVTGKDQDKLYGYIDPQGKVAIPLQFSDAQPFYEKWACVATGTGQGKRWGYIGLDGKFIITPQFTEANSFTEDKAAVATAFNALGLGSKWGFIGRDGKFVIMPQFDKAESFAEGLAPVMVLANAYGTEGKWGFIDGQGKMAIPPAYTEVTNFSDGVACFTTAKDPLTKGTWGFIDKQGNVVVKPKFDYSGSLTFENGKAFMAMGGKYLYVDKQGNPVPDEKK